MTLGITLPSLSMLCIDAWNTFFDFLCFLNAYALIIPWSSLSYVFVCSYLTVVCKMVVITGKQF